MLVRSLPLTPVASRGTRPLTVTASYQRRRIDGKVDAG